MDVNPYGNLAFHISVQVDSNPPESTKVDLSGFGSLWGSGFKTEKLVVRL